MVFTAMFGQTYTLIVFVVEPVHLEIVVRIDRIYVSPKHQTSIVVVLLDVCIQIKIGNVSIGRIHDVAMKG
jgi:hypothetical protein